MKLYDFSEAKKKRDARLEAEQVKALVPHLNEPGRVIEFKRRVEGFMVLHQELEEILRVKRQM